MGSVERRRSLWWGVGWRYGALSMRKFEIVGARMSVRGKERLPSGFDS